MQVRGISEAAGLRMKATNTIVDHWPLRGKKDAPQEEFDLLFAAGHQGRARYVE